MDQKKPRTGELLPEIAEHVFFTCPRYINQRNYLETTMRFQVTPDNIVHLILSSCDNWNAVRAFARRVLMQQTLAEIAKLAELDGSSAESPSPEVTLDTCDERG